mmetsp:Transcript_2044/g.4142  ORF Transcript_2044/g.4142 Transcript_2044/m.4142 type:complete len:99 (-) Transcript_2044:380-676(-)
MIAISLASSTAHVQNAQRVMFGQGQRFRSPGILNGGWDMELILGVIHVPFLYVFLRIEWINAGSNLPYLVRHSSSNWVSMDLCRMLSPASNGTLAERY